MSKLSNAREELLRQLTKAAHDVPDWGYQPDPGDWLKAIEKFIDTKIEAAQTKNPP